jgi:hypothetical protein
MDERANMSGVPSVENQVKVIGHQAVAEHRQRVTSFGLSQKAYENKIVKSCSKYRVFIVPSVDDVIEGSIDEFSGGSRHSLSKKDYSGING